MGPKVSMKPKVPTWVEAGHRPNENSTISHGGEAVGFPMKPVGKCCVMTRASSHAHADEGGDPFPLVVPLVSQFALRTTSGWPPACEVVGTISKKLIFSLPSAAPAQTHRAASSAASISPMRG